MSWVQLQGATLTLDNLERRVESPAIATQIWTVITEAPFEVTLIKASSGATCHPTKHPLNRFLFQVVYVAISSQNKCWFQVLVIVNGTQLDLVFPQCSEGLSSASVQPNPRRVPSAWHWRPEDKEGLLRVMQECRTMHRDEQCRMIAKVEDTRFKFDLETAFDTNQLKNLEYYFNVLENQIILWCPLELDKTLQAGVDTWLFTAEEAIESSPNRCKLRLQYSVERNRKKQSPPAISVEMCSNWRVFSDFEPPSMLQKESLSDYTPRLVDHLGKFLRKSIRGLRQRREILGRMLHNLGKQLMPSAMLERDLNDCKGTLAIYHGKKREPVCLMITIPRNFPENIPEIWMLAPTYLEPNLEKAELFYEFDHQNFNDDEVEENLCEVVKTQLTWQLPEFIARCKNQRPRT